MTSPVARSDVPKILLILGVALALRSAFLAKESLWLDELASWWFTSGPWVRTLGAEAANPPLYFTLLRFWIQLFGTGEAALRAFSVPFSVASVFLTYHIGKKFFSGAVGLVAALYQTISSFHVFYAQEARAHAMLLFLILASTSVLLEAVEARSPRRAGFLFGIYALSMTASLYTHFITVFFLAAHGLYVLLSRPRDLAFFGRWVCAAVAALLLFFPWLRVMLATAAGGGQHRRYLLLKLPQTFFSLLFGDTLIPLDERAVQDVAGTLREYSMVLAATLMVTLILLPFCVAAFKRWRAGALLVVVMGTAPVLLCFLVSFKVMVLDERYMLSCSPFLYLGVAAGGLEIWRRLRGEPLRIATVAGAVALAGYGVLLTVSLYNYYFSPRFGKEQWREAVALVDSRATSSDLILLDPDYLRHGFNYYGRRSIATLPLTDPLLERTLSRDPEMMARLRQHDRIWLVRSHYQDDRLLNLLRETLAQQDRFVFPKGKGIEIHQFAVTALSNPQKLGPGQPH